VGRGSRQRPALDASERRMIAPGTLENWERPRVADQTANGGRAPPPSACSDALHREQGRSLFRKDGGRAGRSGTAPPPAAADTQPAA